MRQVTLSDGTVLEVRGLFRKEVREMKEKGMDPGGVTPERAFDALEHVLALTVPDSAMRARLEDLPNADSMRIWRGVMRETFGSEDETKN
jgi:hypothetical protein